MHTQHIWNIHTDSQSFKVCYIFFCLYCLLSISLRKRRRGGYFSAIYLTLLQIWHISKTFLIHVAMCQKKIQKKIKNISIEKWMFSLVQLPRLPRCVSKTEEAGCFFYWEKISQNAGGSSLSVWVDKILSKMIKYQAIPSYVKRQTSLFNQHNSIQHFLSSLRKKWGHAAVVHIHKFLVSLNSWSAECLHALPVIFNQLWWQLGLHILMDIPSHSHVNTSQCLARCHCEIFNNCIWYHDSFSWFILLASTAIEWNFLLLLFLSSYTAQKNKDSSGKPMSSSLCLKILECWQWILSEMLLQPLTYFAFIKTIFWSIIPASVSSLTKIKSQFPPIFALSDFAWSHKPCPTVQSLSPIYVQYRRDEDSITFQSMNYFYK